MPFLFVDYNQGAGGEYICYVLSQSPECVPLKSKLFDSGRTKVQDIFDQEFLKFSPSVQEIPDIPRDKYTVVPTHMRTSTAEKILGKIKSIRIKLPQEKIYYDFLKDQKIKKVLLSTEPSSDYFLGYIRCLRDDYKNNDFVKKVNRNMDNLTLLLMAKGIEPNEQNRQEHLNNIKTFKVESEPDYSYDLIIPYEKLFVDPEWVVEQIKNKFNITVDIKLFEKFKNEFDQYQTTS